VIYDLTKITLQYFRSEKVAPAPWWTYHDTKATYDENQSVETAILPGPDDIGLRGIQVISVQFMCIAFKF
jgi:hypothetical protein